MFEHSSAPVIPRRAFYLRMARSALIVAAFTLLSLFVGMTGYRCLEGFSWTDSFLNAAMILGGMGEIDPLRTEAGKIFAGIYALYSGLLVLASMGIVLAPVFHRVLHRFHLGRN